MSFEEGIINFNNQLSFEGLIDYNLEGLEEYSKPDGIVISGMGGSGLPGEILRGLSYEIGLNVPVILWKTYGAPRHSFKNPFFIFVSFSGDTEEVVSGLEEMKMEKLPIAIVTNKNGGKLKGLAEKHGLPQVLFDPLNLTPRQSYAKMYYAVIKLLNVYFSSIKTDDLSQKISPDSLRERGRVIAENIKDKIVLIYTYPQYHHLGYAWKIHLNETAKQPSFANDFPELNHNEVVSFTNKEFPFLALFLADEDEIFARSNKKMEVVREFLDKYNIPSRKIVLIGENIEEKTWNGIALAKWTSFYLAGLNGVDPKSTEAINEIKQG